MQHICNTAVYNADMRMDRELQIELGLIKLPSKKELCRRETKKKIKRGDRKKTPCFCGETNVQAHHPDYDDPDNVVFLCKFHHYEHHYNEATDERVRRLFKSQMERARK